jgi:DNA polymerase-3 subunit delta'
MAFSNIIGQEVAKRILKNSILHQRIASSYLFCGPPGVGKTLTAHTFAKALSCEKMRGDSCDECKTCHNIDRGISMNLIYIKPNGKGNIGIDSIREIKKELSFKRVGTGYRVIIIEPADRMTEEASNSFLKILEEPPMMSLFILITTKQNFLLPTIVSRCQKIPFRRLKRDEIKKFLKRSGNKQNVELATWLANGNLARAMDILENPEIEMRKTVLSFIAEKEKRIAILNDIKSSFDSFMLNLPLIYRDLLSISLGCNSVLNKDLRLKGINMKTSCILKSLTICDEVTLALKRNVSKDSALYYLAFKLP